MTFQQDRVCVEDYYIMYQQQLNNHTLYTTVFQLINFEN